ncbi:hypothetical protein Tco_0616808, partial [Tanacetum coccineum]
VRPVAEDEMFRVVQCNKAVEANDHKGDVCWSGFH